MSDNNQDFRVSNFTRIIVSIVVLLIITLIVSDFYFYDPKGYITNSIIILIGFLIILSLAEMFDQMALGKFITLKKNFKEKENDNKVLRDENSGLRNQIIQMTTNLAQIQTQSNNVTVQNSVSDRLVEKLLEQIVPATKPEVEQKKKEEEEDLNQIIKNSRTNKKRYDWRKIENYVIEKITKELELSNLEVIQNAKLTYQRTIQDPISNHQILFDAYFPAKEIFIEVRPNNMPSTLFRDRLYVMLSKLMYFSSRLRNNRALLILVLVDINDDNERNNTPMIENVFSEFDPAIKQEILIVRLETIEGNMLDQFVKE